jgi:muramoyltetrapeptide carboxypeptidase
MRRKDFLTAMATAAVSLPAVAAASTDEEPVKPFIVPPYLTRGAKIGITCPAGFITMEGIQPAVKQLESWGYQVVYGSTIGKRDFNFGGSDEERYQDLQTMIDSSELSAIMCARGGYGAVRLIDKLNFSRLKQFPKWLIGFSDITVIHSHLARHQQVASIHSKMCNSFPDDWNKADGIQVATILSIRDALGGRPLKYPVDVHPANTPGIGTGPLVGGNMKTIESLIGTSSDLPTTGAILFLEDTNEYLYSIDRMFRHLQRSGKFDRLAGLVLGGFKIKPDDPGEEFGRSFHDIVTAIITDAPFPVCFNFPVGHQKDNFALKCGVVHTLTVNNKQVSLQETATKFPIN